jgi:adenylate cyclase, class 2
MKASRAPRKPGHAARTKSASVPKRGSDLIMLFRARLWQHHRRHIGTHAVYCAVPQAQKTNREIEVKLPFSDIRAALAAIKALGAVSHGRVFEQNTLYDTPRSDLRRRGRLLRVRIEAAAPPRSRNRHRRVRRVVLTSKAPPHQPQGTRKSPRYKERVEREVTASRSRDWAASLRTLGFKPSFRYDKYRTSFRLRGLHMDLDETPVGVFLELEGRPAAIDRVARALGYTPAAYILGTYWDVYAADCRRRGRELKNMAFHAK